MRELNHPLAQGLGDCYSYSLNVSPPTTTISVKMESYSGPSKSLSRVVKYPLALAFFFFRFESSASANVRPSSPCQVTAFHGSHDVFIEFSLSPSSLEFSLPTAGLTLLPSQWLWVFRVVVRFIVLRPCFLSWDTR